MITYYEHRYTTSTSTVRAPVRYENRYTVRTGTLYAIMSTYIMSSGILQATVH